jgi:hypothetical protein
VVVRRGQDRGRVPARMTSLNGEPAAARQDVRGVRRAQGVEEAAHPANPRPLLPKGTVSGYATQRHRGAIVANNLGVTCGPTRPGPG